MPDADQRKRKATENAPAANTDAASAQRPPEAQSESYMRQAESDWAALAVRPIPGLLDRILADDYVAVSSKGDVRDKAEQLKLDAPDPAYGSSKLDAVHYRHFGDTVIAQGGESLPSKSIHSFAYAITGLRSDRSRMGNAKPVLRL